MRRSNEPGRPGGGAWRGRGGAGARGAGPRGRMGRITGCERGPHTGCTPCAARPVSTRLLLHLDVQKDERDATLMVNRPT